MSMISKMCKELEVVAKLFCPTCEADNYGMNCGEAYKTVNEAIEVIGELSEKLHAANMDRSKRFYCGGWIDLLYERFPSNGEHVLVSFANHPYPIVCTYIEDDEGGAFCDDSGHSMGGYGFIANAWMPLPEPFEED